MQTRAWHLGCSTAALTVVKTHNFLSGTAGRKLPNGTSSDAKSPTAREPVGLMLAKESSSFGMSFLLGGRETRKPAFDVEVP